MLRAKNGKLIPYLSWYLFINNKQFKQLNVNCSETPRRKVVLNKVETYIHNSVLI